MTKLVIFDHDGLMVNSENIVFAALQHLFREQKQEISWEYYCTTIGLPVVESIKTYLRDFPLNLTFEEFFEERNKLVDELLETELQPMAGLLSLLEYLKSRGVRMVVASSGRREYIEKNLARYNIAAYFSAIVSVDDVQRGKPFPDIFLQALAVTETDSADALVLEDAPHGVEAASRAGIFCIAVPTRGINYNRFQQADIIAENLDTVRKVLSFLPVI